MFRQGRVCGTNVFEAFDHDFPSWSEGVLIPHGLFDPVRNGGHVHLGLSHETTELACDSIPWYGNRIGQPCYPAADSRWLLLDCGGSNSASNDLFQHGRQAVANNIGMKFQVAHDPSDCSKDNLIERRFFPPLSRACTGRLFDSLQTAIDWMRKAGPSTGLRTTVNVIRRVYETGKAATEEMKQHLRATIQFADCLPNGNDTALPQIGQ